MGWENDFLRRVMEMSGVFMLWVACSVTVPPVLGFVEFLNRQDGVAVIRAGVNGFDGITFLFSLIAIAHLFFV